MKKLISRIFIAGLLLCLAGAPLFADNAKVTYVKGKVEVQRGAEWVPLKVGDSVAPSETVSTGFQSEARLNLNGSVLAVAALSRVTLETLSSAGSRDSVSLYVDTGAVRSKVTHTEGRKVDYTTRTSVAVASVRGTDFLITARGNVNCTEGAVAVFPAKYYNPAVVSDRSSPEEEGAPEDVGNEAPGADEGPANANTAPQNISENAPSSGAVVVGAGQSTSFGSDGVPEKPFTEAKKSAEKAKNGGVATAADKELVSTNFGGGAPKDRNSPGGGDPASTGDLVISIEFAE